MAQFYTKSISGMELRLLQTIKESGKEVFTTKEIKENWRLKGWPNILINLKRKGLITQLERGKYIFPDTEADSFLIGTRLITPAAIGYWSALNYYELTEQIPNIVFVQSTSRKKSREILNVRYQFINLSAHKFFGFRKEWIGRDFFIITDLEKTIVDCFDRPEHAGGFSEAIKGLLSSHEKIDKEKLLSYAFRLGNNTVIKRIGYISEILKLKDFEKFRSEAKKVLASRYTILNPLTAREGRHSRKWRLFLNITEDEITNIAMVAS